MCERITAASTRVAGREFDGPCHGDTQCAAAAWVQTQGSVAGESEDGFRTSTGRWVTRVEALQIGRRAAQMHYAEGDEYGDGTHATTEDFCGEAEHGFPT